MTYLEQAYIIAASGNKISIPYLQRNFKISFEEAKNIFEKLFPANTSEPVKERYYYFREYWRKKNGQ